MRVRMGLGMSEVAVSDSLGVVRPRSSRHTALDDVENDPSALSSADTVTGSEDAFGLVYDATAGMVLGVSSTFSDEVTLL